MYDFETTTQTGNISGNEDEPVQLSACVIHPRKLEVVEGSEFSSFIRPPDGFTPTLDSLAWHAKVRGCTVEKIKELWYGTPEKETPSQQTVWQSFMKFLDRYHCESKRKSMFSAPIRAGWNIINYDNHIWARMCKRWGFTDKTGEQNVVLEGMNIDVMHNWLMWTENNPDVEKLAFDPTRKYLGMKVEGGHDSDKDVKDTASLLIRLLKLHRYVADKTKFEGSFR